MSERGVVMGKPESNDFHWPPSNYDRLLGASAVGRQLRPPCVGSAATGAESGHDFPSLIASDVAEGTSAKMAVGEGSINRRVRFSDEGPYGDIKESVVRFRQSGKILKSGGPQVRSSQMQTAARPSVAKVPIRSAIKPSKSIDKASNVQNPSDFEGASISMVANASVSSSTIADKRNVSMSESNRVRTGVKVKMNKAAVKRQDCIRQRLRADWIKYSGSLKTCPFL